MDKHACLGRKAYRYVGIKRARERCTYRVEDVSRTE